jgi:predicted transcriptional regulator
MPKVKTAISVPEDLFEQMDKLARRWRVPRSRLIARAVEEFLERRKSDEITARLDRAYADKETPEENALRRHAAGAFRRLLEDKR